MQGVREVRGLAGPEPLPGVGVEYVVGEGDGGVAAGGVVVPGRSDDEDVMALGVHGDVHRRCPGADQPGLVDQGFKRSVDVGLHRGPAPGQAEVRAAVDPELLGGVFDRALPPIGGALGNDVAAPAAAVEVGDVLAHSRVGHAEEHGAALDDDVR